ncbi:hypothetical protein KJ632_05455 [Patescibacteria group bacterium]|nr:hypothetical protein [Patescibacteria group bacterium]
MKIVSWFFSLFSLYVNSFERKVDKFFKHLKSTDSIAGIREDLLELMQENLIVLNVWLEKRFRGYQYLNKSRRRKMYANLEIIRLKFEDHCKNFPVDQTVLQEALLKKSLSFPHGDEAKISYIFQIMDFLKPGLYYNYIKTASFGKLLNNPDKERLEGDCNQIVTFYMYFYSLKFPIEDLKIKLLSGHVCLHFRDIDIEATNAQFEKYKDFEHLLPATEIISTNLLDLADFREEAQKISPRDVVKSSQLAYAISSLKSVVSKNLDTAYHNLAMSAIRGKDFETAIFYLQKTGDSKVLSDVYKNAAVYYMDQHNFGKASLFAEKSHDADLQKSVKHNEGVYYYNTGKIEQALIIFEGLGETEMKKACYGKQYNKLAAKVKGVKTMEQARKKRTIYKKMDDLARKMGDDGLRNDLKSFLK